MISVARSVAYEVLLAVEKGQAFSNLALKQALRKVHLEERDKGLCTEIVYGTLQRQRSLDAVLQTVSSRPLKKLDTRVLVILRMTAYQALFLTRIPSYAAVNDAVSLCRSVNPRGAGFANAVLRALLRDERPVEARLQQVANAASNGQWADEMGILHSYPTWLVGAFEGTFGREKTLAILEACNQPAHLAVRVNLKRATREDVLLRIRNELGDIASPSPITPLGIRFHKGVDIERLTVYQEGLVTVQDEGAMLIAPLLDVNEDARVLDMCAAPGTKTTQIAERVSEGGTVFACDIHEHKLNLIQKAANRLELDNIRVLLTDARMLRDRIGNDEWYDAVLLDAPCSGFGVLRHRPDIRWRRTAEDVKKLATLQRELLVAAAGLVRPGGTIVYSTCTLLPEENEELLNSVVADPSLHLAFDNLEQEFPNELWKCVGNTYGFTLTPDLYETDGFYMARLRKRD